jgi:hypothetical protein
MDAQAFRKAMPLRPWMTAWRISVDPDGAVVRCTSESLTTGAQATVRPCTTEERLSPERLRQLRGLLRKAYEVVFYVVQTVDGMPNPPLPPDVADLTQYSRVTIAFDVDRAGRPGGCRETAREKDGEAAWRFSKGMCDWVHDFTPDATPIERSATVTFGYYTSGSQYIMAPAPPPVPPPPHP